MVSVLEFVIGMGFVIVVAVKNWIVNQLHLFLFRLILLRTLLCELTLSKGWRIRSFDLLHVLVHHFLPESIMGIHHRCFILDFLEVRLLPIVQMV